MDITNLSVCRSGEKYWGVQLDGRVIKTMYKDNLCLPSKTLVVMLAEEWESQDKVMDITSLHMNNMVAKGIRA